MRDRSIPPALQPFPQVSLTVPQWRVLPNGVKMCQIDRGEVEVVQVDVYIGGGVLEQNQRFVAQLLNTMLSKGSKNYDAEQIAEQMAFYGAELGGSVSDHHQKVTLRCMNSVLPKLMPIFFDCITAPQFDDKRFQKTVERMMANAAVMRQRVDFLASTLMSQMLYGEHSMLAGEFDSESLPLVTTEHLRCFHKKYFAPANCQVVISGKVTPEIASEVERWFASWQTCAFEPLTQWNFVPRSQGECRVIERKDSLQSAVVGSLDAINRSHPHYIGLRILVTAFGGYFGSRLMRNIREDKGYTYGIQAYLAGRKEEGHIAISTQCNAQHTANVIDEIKKEMCRLCEEPICEEELNMVRRHMLSQLLSTFDTAFALADYVGSTICYGVHPHYFNRQYALVQSITPEELQSLAKQYFIPDKLLIAVAGSALK
ncbi:MAG: M16 family metallopeptidase [Muribaculaceae bacterium]